MEQSAALGLSRAAGRKAALCQNESDAARPAPPARPSEQVGELTACGDAASDPLMIPPPDRAGIRKLREMEAYLKEPGACPDLGQPSSL
jgi:hypothetical protein